MTFELHFQTEQNHLLKSTNILYIIEVRIRLSIQLKVSSMAGGAYGKNKNNTGKLG